MGKIVIVDYGCGNILSLKRALKFVGFEPELTNDKNKILKANSVILPGVGAFGNAMQLLNKKGLVSVLKDYANKEKKPLLGICLGMQILLSKGFEFGENKGLDLIPGVVDRIKLKDQNNKIPHIGWNKIFIDQKNHSLFDFDSEKFYFVHSFIAITKKLDNTLAKTEYGGVKLPAIIKMKNIIGCQFHPEKSRSIGLEFLKNFCMNKFI